MSRRRPTFAAYALRRWRAIGAIVVLALGALLVLAVTDRGNDPAWTTRVDEIDQAALAPDGAVAYALVRDGDNVSGLHAVDGLTGDPLWSGPLRAPRAVLGAGGERVAVATDFPLAFLTLFDAEGSARWQHALEGNPVAIAMDDAKLALALNAPGNPVLLFEDDLLVRTYRLPSPVRALDLEEGIVVTGGLHGEVVAHRGREQILNVTLPMSVRSIRLAQDGTALVAGGFALTPGDPNGRVAFLDIDAARPVRWSQETPAGVGLVDIDAAGLRALAVEDEPPAATIHLYEGSTGATRWTRLLPGSVARADSGAAGGAALSPDGDAVAVGTLRGEILLLEADDGRERWSYRAGGAGVVTFADGEPRRVLAGARLLENHPFDSLLLFSTAGEPVSQRAPVLAGAILAVGAGALGLVVGLGFWRVRRAH